MTNPEKAPAAPMHLAQVLKKSRRECAQAPQKMGSSVLDSIDFIKYKKLKLNLMPQK
jgi:hypothetical protein